MQKITLNFRKILGSAITPQAEPNQISSYKVQKITVEEEVTVETG